MKPVAKPPKAAWFPKNPAKLLLKFFAMATASLAILLFGGFFVFLIAADNSGEYRQKIDACLKARSAEGAGAKSITDYVCPEGLVVSQFDVAYQVVLDLEFQKLDKEIKKELQNYQWKKTKKSTEVNDQLVKWFDETGPDAEKSFSTKYRKICQDVQAEGNPIAEVVKAYSGTTTEGQISEFLYGPSSCNALVSTKMAAFRQIGYLIGVKNTAQSFIEDKEKFADDLNDEYKNFLMQWTIYVGELSRIKSKWNIKTKIHNE